MQIYLQTIKRIKRNNLLITGIL